MDPFQYNLAGMFLWWPSTKIVQAVMIHQKSWPLGGGAYFPYIENFKNLLVRNSWTEFNVTWQECCFGDLLPRLFKPSWYVKNHGPQGVGGGGGCLFFIYICIENFKILLVTYPMTDFNITWLECCFGEPLSRLYKQSWFVKKHGCHGVGLVFRIYLNRKL